MTYFRSQFIILEQPSIWVRWLQWKSQSYSSTAVCSLLGTSIQWRRLSLRSVSYSGLLLSCLDVSGTSLSIPYVISWSCLNGVWIMEGISWMPWFPVGYLTYSSYTSQSTWSVGSNYHQKWMSLSAGFSFLALGMSWTVLVDYSWQSGMIGLA